MQPSSIIDPARRIVDHLAGSLESPETFSSMSPAVYDTAWLAMVFKTEEDGRTHWLFPECFQYLLGSQLADGGFDNTSSSDVDGILHTMAALLALLRHAQRPSIGGCPSSPDIQDRILRAKEFLQRKLTHWDVGSTVHVGFEILVPAVLEALQLEGAEFLFPGSAALLTINQQKLARFSPAILYAPKQTTLLHSLEAFVGRIDFDKVRHHLCNGSMMGSPSSTAAYLMNCSTWDPAAESYLRSVATAGYGCAPSAFPTTVFAFTWTISTLVEAGFATDVLGEQSISKIGNFLEDQLRAGNGVVGFAPGFLPDADDTAKTIISLSLLGRPTRCERMIEVFETPSHFMTYPDERNESFSANCNVLKALLYAENPSSHLPQICKAADFLCRCWYAGKVNDKWNLEVQYSMMLLSEALVLLLKLWEQNALLDVPEDLVANRIPILLFQVLTRTLSAQSESGSWGQHKPSTETTAYGILTLKLTGSLPWAEPLNQEIVSAIRRGVSFLESNKASWRKPQYIWIEKVSYGSSLLSEAYCLAALKCSGEYAWGEKVSRLHQIPSAIIDKFYRFLSKLPVLSTEIGWRLRASIIEGFLFGPALRQVRLNIFPRKDMSEDHYLDYIPVCWTASNNATGDGLSVDVMWEMMVISMLDFQADEYLEGVVGQKYKGQFDAVRTVIRELFCDHPVHRAANGQNGHAHNDALLLEVKTTLSRFVDYVLSHPKVSESARASRRMKQELLAFLLAHVQHVEDNAKLFPPSNGSSNGTAGTVRNMQPHNLNEPYFNWVRTTAADHTSGPYCFEYFGCLIATKPGKDCFRGTMQRYIFQDLGRHLATMSRQYNDYGSMVRDREEGNLNSVNFPEFHENDCPDLDREQQLENQIRAELFRIATYERECVELAVRRLAQEVTPAISKAIQVFVNATDMFGQIYVVRDISTRLK